MPCRVKGGYFGLSKPNSQSANILIQNSSVSKLDDKSFSVVNESILSMKSRNLQSAVSKKSNLNEKGEFYAGWKPNLKKIQCFDKPSYYVDYINPKRVDFNRYYVGGMPNIQTGQYVNGG